MWLALLSLPSAQAQPEQWLDSVLALRSAGSLCAGVLVDADIVLTAYHCVAAGRPVQVQTRGGQSSFGQVIASSASADIALLHVPELTGIAPLELAPPATIGQEAWALGHPFGTASEQSKGLAGVLMWSASKGVVSGRSEHWLQIDTPVNPGNSGGPIVDAQGRILGIASSKLKGDGVAFAAPVSEIQALMADSEPKVLGGSYGAGLSLFLPSSIAQVPSLGGQVQMDVRDRVLLELGAAVGIDRGWRALSQETPASWTAGTALLSWRLRTGTGMWSTTLDLGAGVALRQWQTGSVQGERLVLRPGMPTIEPAAQLRLGLAGSASLKLLVRPAVDAGLPVDLCMGVEWGWPGRVGVW